MTDDPITNPLTALAVTALLDPPRLKPMVQSAFRQTAGLVLGAVAQELLSGDSQPPRNAPPRDPAKR